MTEEDDFIRDFADRAFRKALENPENLKEFIGRVVPDLANGFDFSQVRYLPRELILPDWRSRESDILAEVPYRVGEEVKWTLVCILLEHQTVPDSRMPLRMLLMAVLYWDREWKNWENSPKPRPEFRLTPILPIILYAGQRDWGNSRTLEAMFNEPSAFHAFAPRWEPLLWQLRDQNPDDLLHSQEVFLQVLTVVRLEEAEREELETRYIELLHRLEKIEGRNHVRWYEMLEFTLGWLLHRRPEEERTHWIDVAEQTQSELNRQREAKQMGTTIAQALRKEGKIEGKIEEAREIILQQGRMQFGEPPSNIEATLEAINDHTRLRELTSRILKVTSWEQLLQNPEA